MGEKTSAALVLVLSELMDSDDEKPTRGKTREWVKRREQSRYFNNIVKELKVEDRLGFREKCRMSDGCRRFRIHTRQNFAFNFTSSNDNFGGHLPIMPDERIALTLRYIATGESFQSLSFQFRISLNAVSYIIKGCCNALVDELVPVFVKTPSSEQE